MQRYKKECKTKNFFDEEMLQSTQKHINVKQKYDCKVGNHWFIAHFSLNLSLMKR